MKPLEQIVRDVEAALAAGPTPGPWRAEQLEANDGTFFPSFTAMPSGRFHHDPQVDADYIAACTPENIRTLLDGLAEITTDRDEWEESCILSNRRFEKAESELAASQERERVLREAIYPGFVLALAALTSTLDSDEDEPSKTKWAAWLEAQIENLSEGINGGEAVDLAIAVLTTPKGQP